MPPRGAARGARGAGRGTPAPRGGPGAAAAAAMGAVAPRGARLPAAGPPQRMLPHQHTPAAVAESYQEYVSCQRAFKASCTRGQDSCSVQCIIRRLFLTGSLPSCLLPLQAYDESYPDTTYQSYDSYYSQPQA